MNIYICFYNVFIKTACSCVVPVVPESFGVKILTGFKLTSQLFNPIFTVLSRWSHGRQGRDFIFYKSILIVFILNFTFSLSNKYIKGRNTLHGFYHQNRFFTLGQRSNCPSADGQILHVTDVFKVNINPEELIECRSSFRQQGAVSLVTAVNKAVLCSKIIFQSGSKPFSVNMQDFWFINCCRKITRRVSNRKTA